MHTGSFSPWAVCTACSPHVTYELRATQVASVECLQSTFRHLNHKLLCILLSSQSPSSHVTCYTSTLEPRSKDFIRCILYFFCKTLDFLCAVCWLLIELLAAGSGVPLFHAQHHHAHFTSSHHEDIWPLLRQDMKYAPITNIYINWTYSVLKIIIWWFWKKKKKNGYGVLIEGYENIIMRVKIKFRRTKWDLLNVMFCVLKIN